MTPCSITGGGQMLLGNGVAAATGYGASIGGSGLAYGLYGGSTFALNWASPVINVYVNNSNVGSLTPAVSDIRLKANVGVPECDALADILALELMSYDLPDRIAHGPARHYRTGFSAQQMEGVIPEAVAKSPMAALEPGRDLLAEPLGDNELMRSLDAMPILARCVGALQQLAARVAALEANA
jgi:hypothetical protein